MKLLINCILLYLCVLLNGKCIAQAFTYTHYDIKDGLAGSTTYCAAQDKDDFIWFGTETGLSRFDGTQFVNFGIAQGLPDNEVLKIFCDSKNRIWLSFFELKICYILNGKVHNQYNDSILKKLQLKGIAWQICEDKQGDILIREDRALHMITPDERLINFQSLDGDSTAIFYSISTSPDGNFFACENNKVYELNAKGKITLFKELSNERFFMRLTYLSRNLFVWHDSRYTYKAYSVSKGDVEKLVNPSTLIEMQILDDSLICSNKMDGSSIQNFFTHKILNVLPGEPVSSVFRDYENNYWFTTLGHGIFRLNSTEFKTLFFTRKTGEHLSVFSIIKNNNTIIAGTDGCYVFQLNKSQPQDFKRYKLRYNDEVKNRVVSLQALNNILYVGTDDILLKVKSYKSNGAIDYLNVKKILLINKDSLLIGTKSNLLLCNPVTLKIIDTLLQGRILCLNKFGRQLFIGTLRGLIIKDLDGGAEKYLNEPVLNTRITALQEDSSGILWIGTYGGGIMAYKNGKFITCITEQNGLISDICRCITVYGNNIWVGTDKGINKIALLPKPHVIGTFTSTDGLPSDVINVILQDSTLIFAGTPLGLTYFNNDISIGNSKCNLQITNIISGSDTLNLRKIILPHNKNNIRFEYVAISYNSGGNIKYYYRIKNLIDTWSVTTSTFVNYPSLPSGKYVFQLKAANKYGVASKAISIPFEIKKQLWQYAGFQISCIILICFLTWYFINRKINQVKRKEIEKNAIKNQIAELKQKAFRLQISPHFIFNCLNSMQQYVVDNDIEGSNRFISNFARLIRKTLEFSEKSEISLKEELIYLETYLKLEEERFENKFQFKITMHSNLNTENYFLPPLLLQPIVENAVRHGVRLRNDKNGEINVDIQLNTACISILIKDNGPGITQSLNAKPSSSKYKSMGMCLVQDRINILNDMRSRKISMHIAECKNYGAFRGTIIKIEIAI